MFSRGTRTSTLKVDSYFNKHVIKMTSCRWFQHIFIAKVTSEKCNLSSPVCHSGYWFYFIAFDNFGSNLIKTKSHKQITHIENSFIKSSFNISKTEKLKWMNEYTDSAQFIGFYIWGMIRVIPWLNYWWRLFSVPHFIWIKVADIHWFNRKILPFG